MVTVSRSLGDAFVNIAATGKTFGAEVARIVKAGTVGQNVSIPVTVNDLAARLSFANLKKARDDLAAKVANIRVSVDDKAGQAQLLRLKARIDELSKNIKPELDLKGLAKYQSQILSAEASADRLDGRKLTVKIDVDKSALDKLTSVVSKAQSKGPSALISAGLLAAPAAAVLGGVGLGAAAGLSGAFVAGAGALAAFGAVAKPVLSDALKASQAVEKAQNNYNAAIAGGTKQSVAYKAEQIAINKAYAELSPAQIRLSKQLGDMAGRWQDLKSSLTPLIAGSLQPWLAGITIGLTSLKSAITPLAPVVHDLGVQFSILMSSSVFKDFVSWVGRIGAVVNKAVGNAFLDFLTAVAFLLPQFTPLIKDAANGLTKWADAFVKWSASQQAADDIKKFIGFVHSNAPTVGEIIRNMAGAIGTLASGLAKGGLLELKVISDFLGFVAKLPKGISGPILEVVGGILLLNKLGAINGLMKVFTAQWWILNAAMDANPIGIIILALELLGVAFVIAYTKSKTFRDFIKGLPKDFDDFRHRTAVIFDGLRGDIAHYWDMTWNNTLGRLTRGIADANKDFDDFRHRTAVVFDGIRGEIGHLWDVLWNNTLGRLKRGIADANKDFDDFRHRTAVVFDGIRGEVGHLWDVLWNNTLGRLERGRHDVAAGFDNVRHDIASRLNSVKADVSHDWDVIWSNTVGRAERGVQDLGRVWGKIEGVIKGPVNFVLQHVLDPLFGAIDDVASFVGIKNLLPTNLHLAKGGRVPGSGSGDTVPALLTPGEVVVPKNLVSQGAVDHLRGHLPGFASGGLVNPLGAGRFRPERIDMGVDYAGSGNLRALGAGTITSLHNSGWPGGGFIGLKLNPPYGSGFWYYAEDVLPTGIHIGSGVSAGQNIALATGGSTGIELGWAAPPGTGQTAAAASGQAAAGQRAGDPGKYSTAWGKAASDLIKSLGGPGGILQPGPIQGGSGGIGGIIGAVIRTVEQILGGIGKYASIGIDLAKGNIAGAVTGLLKTFKPGAGGAGGQFANMLLQLPVTLIKKAVGFLASKVKSFVSGQQSGPSSGPGVPGTSAQVKAWILAALSIAGKPANWLNGMETLVSKESGGNPLAVNRTSAGIAAGTPEGIAQTVPGTFSLYSLAGHKNIWNPIDDLIASVRYIADKYRSVYNIPGITGGAYRGYALGGVIPEHVLGVGLSSGQRYSFGEHGPETVTPGTGAPVAPADGGMTAMQANVLIALVEKLIVATVAAPHGFARSLNGNMSQAASVGLYGG